MSAPKSSIGRAGNASGLAEKILMMSLGLSGFGDTFKHHLSIFTIKGGPQTRLACEMQLGKNGTCGLEH